MIARSIRIVISTLFCKGNSRALKSSYLPLVCVAALGAGATSAFGNVIFSDSTFNLSNYSPSATYNTNPSILTITVSTAANANRTATGPALDFNYSYNQSFTTEIDSFAAEMNNTWTYNPSVSGAISGINFSADKNLVLPPDYTITFISAGAILEQGGNFYVDFVAGSPTSGYQTISASGLQASAFGLYNFTTGAVNAGSNPNFSSSGGLIEFGIGNRFNTSAFARAFTGDAFYDNVAWTITNGSSSATPEPSSLLLAAVGLFGAAVVARRRKSA